MKTEVRTLVLAVVVIAMCATGVLVFRHPPDLSPTIAVQPPQILSQSNFEPTTQPRRPRTRPEQTLSHAAAATPIAPPEPPEDPDEAREWARQNPHDALAWMLNAPAGEKRDTVAEMACARVAESDPARAVSLAERFSGGNSNLLENMVQQWAERDQPSATAYAIQKPPGEERDRLLSRVALARSRENPLDAAKLVAESISPGEVQNEAAISVLHQLALRDPKSALAWVEGFREEALRDRALTEMWNILSPKEE